MGNIKPVTVWRSWPEIIGFFLLLIGFVIALSIRKLWLNYMIIFLAGLMAGRIIFEKKGKQPIFPFYLILIIFLVGYLLGSIAFNKIPILLIFIVSAYGSFRVHKEGIIP